ncbi:hypothetical protein XFLAVUS301_50340 [Xanthobacter flavus]|uniref:Uncharacterized protein n=1 Tax=Xanthobacter flavus TaxID=281 RepID=A0A9W6CRZ7_XANFL|nr:hypothetical protein XFLAVUS301_50340 [Xanthobacter flavus]
MGLERRDPRLQQADAPPAAQRHDEAHEGHHRKGEDHQNKKRPLIHRDQPGCVPRNRNVSAAAWLDTSG